MKSVAHPPPPSPSSRIVAFGEIMARFATPGFQRFRQAMPGSLNVTFAGAEASIAASIAILGGNAAFVTALPNHVIADACVADLRSTGVDTNLILRTTEGRLGLYFLEHGTNQRPGEVIYDRAGSAVAITPADAYDWDMVFASAGWFVISGITPAISRNAAEVTMVALQEATDRGVRVVLDANYRSKLWQWNPPIDPRSLATWTMLEMLPYVDQFVGGREDLESLLGLDATLPLEELIREFAHKYPRLQRVAMTLRENISATHQTFGGLLFDHETDRIYHAPINGPSYEIANIVDRLGAGDAFTAGLIFSLTTPGLSDPQTALSFATAAGCLAHSIEGDFNYVTRAEIEELMAGTNGGRVKR